MADRPRRDPQGRDEPEFDWLYGTGGTQDGRPGDAGGFRDPEPTQMLPTMSRPPPGGSSTQPRTSPGPRTPPPSRTPPPTRPRTGPPPGRGGRRPRLAWLVYLLVVWAVFLVAVPVLAWQKVERVDATPSGSRPAAQPGTTYLLVGS